MVRYHPQYTEYEVSIDSKVVYLWFTKSSVSAAELNLELKPQEKNIRKKYLTHYRWNMKCQLILRWFAYGSPRVVFLL